MKPDIAQLARAAEDQLRAGAVEGAIAAYRALLAREPALPDAWYNLGYLLRVDRAFEAALDAYGEALARGVAEPESVHVNRAAILADHLDRTVDANAELRKALAANPNYLPALLNLGNLCEDCGDFAGARAAYEEALKADPANGRAHARLTTLDIVAGETTASAPRLSAALTAQERDPVSRAELLYAKAQLLDAEGDYPAAFATLREANSLAYDLIDPRIRYDPAAQDAMIDLLIDTFPSAPAKGEASSPEPLFVCGMFRSGSTLCETVLARHSRITAGGEREFVPLVASRDPAYPHGVLAEAPALRDGYLAETHRLWPGAQIVTDKRPDNVLHVGLIKTMFPDSRIVHTVRDPLDTALSVFFLYFEDSVAYGARLSDIAHYYRAYRRLMAHWERLYGTDIVAFDYDSFVAAPEAEARRLFEGLGLDWEDGCVPGSAQPGTVRTPSAWAVRQPVHTRSSGRWRNYEVMLADVKAALDAA